MRIESNGARIPDAKAPGRLAGVHGPGPAARSGSVARALAAWCLATAILASGARPVLAQQGAGETPAPVTPPPAPVLAPEPSFVPSEKITGDSSVSFPVDI